MRRARRTPAFRPSVEAIEARLSTSHLPALGPAPAASHAVSVAAAASEARLDRRRFPEERERVLSRQSRHELPLLGADFEVLSPSTGRYNCIAHALGVHDRWIMPRTGPAADPFRYTDRWFAARGFHRLDALDFSLQAGVEKVVIYATRTARNPVAKIQHAARQHADGTWSSKLGINPLIRHLSPDALRGPLYGRPVAVYARSVFA